MATSKQKAKRDRSKGATPLTDQQSNAVVTRDVSVVLSSGAGCGKTHVLTERYLSHLRDDGAEVGQIVAITFTARAARQMRGRILAAITAHLRDAATESDADTWTRHLRALETAPISTIHSFCSTLLRRYAVDAGLDPTFEVLEEVLAVNVQAEAIEETLQALLTSESETGEDLRQLVLLFGWSRAVDTIGRLLDIWDAARWKSWFEREPEDIATAWRTEAAATSKEYRAYKLSQQSYVTHLEDLLKRNPPKPGEMAERVQVLLDGIPKLAEESTSAETIEALASAAQVGKIGKAAWNDPTVYEEIKDAMTAFREKIKKLDLDRFTDPGESLGEAVRVGQRFLRVAAAVVRAYRDRKQFQGLLDFQDLVVLTRDLLRDRADIRARLQERYRFVLVDELQDTDPVQMELIEYLCGAGVTQGKLFAVGDSKQSIYRFRGAVVKLFDELRDRMDHSGRQALTVNFRSQPAILKFVNALFAGRLRDYEPLEPHEKQVAQEPCIEFLWSVRTKEMRVGDARRLEAATIAGRIARMVGPKAESLAVDREAKPARPRSVRPGDVVLLFRAMTNVHLYEAALREKGIDYYIVGGRAFFAQQEIYDVLNLLRALENPHDSLSLAGTLRSPFCGVSDESLFVLSAPREGLWAGLMNESLNDSLPADQREAVALARRNLQRWRGLKDRRPIAGLLNTVFADSGFDAATQFEYLGDRKLANLWKLVDLARTFDRSGLFGLAEFIARLDDLVRAQPREEQAATQPENADVVRLMSIHQAKGLEFPVVFVPDFAAERNSGFQPAAAWDPKLGCVVRPPEEPDGLPFPDFGWKLHQAREELEDWQEDLRTLYVACTRARDYLVLSAALKEDLTANSDWWRTLAERFDPETGACIANDVLEQDRPKVLANVTHPKRSE